jgi:Ca-activated chloride channel family protein
MADAIHWEYPQHVWCLLVAGCGAVFLTVGWVRQRRALRCFLRQGASQQWWRGLGAAALQAAALGLIGVAVLGPCWGWRQSPAEPVLGRDLLVVLDVSRSMLCQDVQPSRLARAKADLAALAGQLEARGGYRLGLILFADRAAVVCPLTTDFRHFREELEQASLETLRLRWSSPASERGTDLAAALACVVRTVASGPAAARTAFVDVLLVSDGGHDTDPLRLTFAEKLAQAGVRVFTVGVGDPRTDWPIPVRTADGRQTWLEHNGEVVRVRLQPEPLREIARATSAAYLAAETRPIPVDTLVSLMENAPRRELSPAAPREPIPRYAWCVFPALLLLLVEPWLRRGRRSQEEADRAAGPQWLARLVRPRAAQRRRPRPLAAASPPVREEAFA